ncbi:MAG: TldD/PmbA family protein [Prochlorothrix sp.]
MIDPTPALDPEQLIELALKAGAEAAEVFQSCALSRPVFFEANRLKQLESAQVEGTALRLWMHGRPGLAVAHGPVDSHALIDRAIGLSHLNNPEDRDLAKQLNHHYPDLGEAVSGEQLVRWGENSIDQIRQQYPDTLCLAEWECESETTRLVNSTGLDCSYTDITLSAYLAADWIRGDDFLNVADGQVQRNHLNPQLLVDQILQRLAWAEERAPVTNGRVPVLFTAKAADMLWGTLQSALNGKQVAEKASPWSDRLGDRVTHPSITLYQQPDVGPFSCPFDDEGNPTRPITFIEGGTLKLFYTDTTTGKTLGSGSTGNGFRPSLSSYPSPGLFNLLVNPGQKPLSELIRNLDEGLIVDQILGGGAGISGEFSINVDLGFWIHKGQVVGRVKDTMVAGNVYTALRQLIALGNDAAWNGSCYTPSVVLEGLSTVGR